MKTLLHTCALLLISWTVIQAQNASSSVSGKILSPEGEAVEFANVVIYDAADSTMLKGEVTASDGVFLLTRLEAGSYWLEASFIGYEPYRSGVFRLEDRTKETLEAIRMQPSSTELATVEVRAKRPLIEVRPDKTVFNVEGSINATGNTALELLRKAPGVVVDNNDNIILTGKNGVQVYIDGKPSYLGAGDLADQLRAMQSSEIDAIEIITNPSAKYDAAGNAGIINIKLKKDKRLGVNAQLNTGYSYGKHSKYNASTSFNYRNKKSNIFGTYAFNDGKHEQWINLRRKQSNFLFEEQGIILRDGPYNSAKLGTDFFLTKHSTLGFLVNGQITDLNLNNSSRTPITDLSTNEPLSVLHALSENDGMRKRLSANVNYRFDRDGVSWNIDADWGIFRNDNESFQPNTYRTPDGQGIIDELVFTSTAPTDIDIYTFKVDHERNAWGGALGVGAKFSYVRTDNDYQFFSLEDDVKELDIDRSNQFEFTENINAAYITFSKQVKKYTMSFGLRGEHTHSDGILTAQKPTNNDRVERDYFDIFPSGGITYQHSPKHQFRLNYSRRIDRPNYQDLNPFEFKLSELAFQRGNPFLQPQYTHNVSLSHTYNYRLTTSLTYSYTDDFFANISDSTDVIRAFLETINLSYQRVINLSVSYPFSFNEWWNTYTNVSAFRTENKAELSAGRLVDIKANVMSLYHQSTFQLPKDFTFELSGWYSSPSIWGAVFETDANYSIDAGVKKQILEGRGNVKVSVTDIFDTAGWRGLQEITGFSIDAMGGWESRQLRVNFSYLFGNDQVKKTRRRSTGLEDEEKRVQ